MSLRKETLNDLNWSNGFTQGYACAISVMIQSHGNNSIYNEAIVAGNLTKENMESCKVDQRDIEIILSNKGW